MKKEIPILYSTPMVQAILAGRKTMTRRIIKIPDEACMWDDYQIEFGLGGWEFVNGSNWLSDLRCPYGEIGDILWVREEHYRFGHWEKNGLTKTGKQKWRFIPVSGSDIYYHCDKLPEKSNKSRVKGKEEFNLLYKRIARFMPKSACRIWLEVTDIRVERLHDITEKDAISEGIKPVESFDSGEGVSSTQMYENYLPDGYTEVMPKDSFESLWRKINGEESWNANQQVWVVSFKVLSTTGKPEEKYITKASDYDFNCRNNLETSYY